MGLLLEVHPLEVRLDKGLCLEGQVVRLRKDLHLWVRQHMD